ncbi:MAG: hypothetical protein OIF36_04325 [Alphaproteobacteria bacterium]|nr:hypothetical protein [Alphaproteobacteria bacterium]
MEFLAGIFASIIEVAKHAMKIGAAGLIGGAILGAIPGLGFPFVSTALAGLGYGAAIGAVYKFSSLAKGGFQASSPAGNAGNEGANPNSGAPSPDKSVTPKLGLKPKRQNPNELDNQNNTPKPKNIEFTEEQKRINKIRGQYSKKSALVEASKIHKLAEKLHKAEVKGSNKGVTSFGGQAKRASDYLDRKVDALRKKEIENINKIRDSYSIEEAQEEAGKIHKLAEKLQQADAKGSNKGATSFGEQAKRASNQIDRKKKKQETQP